MAPTTVTPAATATPPTRVGRVAGPATEAAIGGWRAGSVPWPNNTRPTSPASAKRSSGSIFRAVSTKSTIRWGTSGLASVRGLGRRWAVENTATRPWVFWNARTPTNIS